MMNLGDLLQGVGLFLCVGALLVGFLAFMLFRSLSNRSNSRDRLGNPRDYERPGTLGTDRDIIDENRPNPTYDDRDIHTQGGFGNVPSTGRGARDYDRDTNRDVDRSLDRDLNRDRDYDRGNLPSDRRRDRDDDDDVRSSGGFGRP